MKDTLNDRNRNEHYLQNGYSGNGNFSHKDK